jgi:hypothetical protein
VDKAWKDMTPKERSAHMLAAKRTKQAAPKPKQVRVPVQKPKAAREPEGRTDSRSPAPAKAIVVVKPSRAASEALYKAAKQMVAETGFGVGWTQEQRDEVLRRINSKPKEGR